MNILIITVYNHDNCGSFYQAYALGQVLVQQGHNVSYLESPLVGKDYSRVYAVLKYIYKGDFKAIPYFLARRGKFKEAHKLLHVYNSPTDPTPEVVVIGSDTLWNHQKSFYRAMAEEYHGLSFPQSKAITYAISVANTSLGEYVNTITPFKDKINICHFLARDYHTKEIIDEAYGLQSEIVCDPTLLLHKEDYDIMARPVSKEKYLLLYYFREMTVSQKEYVKQFADNFKLKIVTFSVRKPWGDKILSASPYNFISWFKEAEYVLTDTFHGTAFSIIFGKRFAVYDENKNKVKELLLQYGLIQHLFKDFRDLCGTMELQNDAIENGVYEKIRENSLKLLYKAISD
ncbi:MAG: polysaccharide pyruvyl transferase family protein [Prevotella ruminicola]|uniref:Polysaccharide pyruvyl transferase family protein n=1 Tax=Xylanibacter ruminicola TaxID=839 RepID=A0A9D5NZH4_XYLRU|nr:polysaccharide pyruvyl transferase family protein [Xylanibacter ruminicola]